VPDNKPICCDVIVSHSVGRIPAEPTSGGDIAPDVFVARDNDHTSGNVTSGKIATSKSCEFVRTCFYYVISCYYVFALMTL